MEPRRAGRAVLQNTYFFTTPSVIESMNMGLRKLSRMRDRFRTMNQFSIIFGDRLKLNSF
ncbi:hypothetical protein LEP1GSC188_0363 [Leptospira weilii serovar Topaz str. LT2116]|uniref:Uncharacterized protein n=1 Tax=Leptospira weilii serovar Topaz str. LT2116 TaxID=1088540 RepID=M3GEK5_9LEPT|nr:hypothetical protein LEP1GSC188_0363 [Leptospira weilii serovar Topaz str. LT2116]